MSVARRILPIVVLLPRNAVQQSGVAVGAALADARVVRCNPWSRGGVDDPPQLLRAGYRITAFGFVGPAAAPGRP